MFKRLHEGTRDVVTLRVDGRPLAARHGETVAAALIAGGISAFRRTPTRGEPRAPYCMMGVCFDCLVTIDGVANRQACLVVVRDGMEIATGQGRRSVGP